MKIGITSIILVAILALIPCLPALAADSGTITITMTGASEISISLDKTAWAIGDVASDTEYLTEPAIQWCTLTNTGNINVNTFIAGEDASWTGGTYAWTLSSDGTSGEHIYGLWFRISGDTTRDYVPITKTQSEFWPYSGGGSSIGAGDTKQFGLKLLTPTFFYAGREMQAHITVSAVAA